MQAKGTATFSSRVQQVLGHRLLGVRQKLSRRYLAAIHASARGIVRSRRALRESERYDSAGEASRHWANSCRLGLERADFRMAGTDPLLGCGVAERRRRNE